MLILPDKNINIFVIDNNVNRFINKKKNRKSD